ncbi:MAG: prepilin peptidase [Sulfuriferula sp.]|nr:prepilin peptidase [Sulfuriferula sp.]
MLILWLLVIVYYDVSWRRVPNQLLLAAMVWQGVNWLVFHTGLFDISLESAVLGFVVSLVVFLPLYVFRLMAAGDVKFFAVLGLLLGPVSLLPIFVIGSLLAGVHALLYKTLHTGNAFLLHLLLVQMQRGRFVRYILQKLDARTGLPYAAYLAIGAIAVVVYTQASWWLPY